MSLEVDSGQKPNVEKFWIGQNVGLYDAFFCWKDIQVTNQMLNNSEWG